MRDLGGTQRLGGHDVALLPGSRVQAMYGRDMVRERFRHRYELNNDYKAAFEKCGVVFCGMTPDQRVMQIFDYPAHPFYVATQFHPELLSRPSAPPPSLLGLCAGGEEASKPVVIIMASRSSLAWAAPTRHVGLDPASRFQGRDDSGAVAKVAGFPLAPGMTIWVFGEGLSS